MRMLRVFLLAILLPGALWAQTPATITLATAGPSNLSHLPVELMAKIGADTAEGFKIKLRFFGGGPLAFQDMLDRNSDFAVAGAPALADLRVKGAPVVSIAPVNRVPTFTLLARKDLASQVKSVADLRGRVIGINTSSRTARSTSQQVAQYLLRQSGVPLDQVHFVPAGQSLQEQRAAFVSRSIDALMGDEPFVSQMAEEGIGDVLADLHDPDVCRRQMGGLFLNAQLATREDVLHTRHDEAQRLVRALARTLQWIASHSAAEIARALHPEDPTAQQQLAGVLARRKAIYSPDGVFTREQIATAETFWRANQTDEKRRAFSFQQLVDTHLAGVREQ